MGQGIQEWTKFVKYNLPKIWRNMETRPYHFKSLKAAFHKFQKYLCQDI